MVPPSRDFGHTPKVLPGLRTPTHCGIHSWFTPKQGQFGGGYIILSSEFIYNQDLIWDDMSVVGGGGGSSGSVNAVDPPVVCYARALYAYAAKPGGKELSLSKDQIIKVFKKYANGWWIGELDDGSGARGVFPGNYVQEIEPPSPSRIVASNPDASDEKKDEEARPRSSSQGQTSCCAVKAYKGASSSHLSFEEGDVILILERYATGWWKGQLNGKVGLFPKDCVTTAVSGSGADAKNKKAMSVYIESKPIDSNELKASPARGATTTSPANAVCKAVALYDFKGMSERELSFSKGAIVNVYSKLQPTGWWKGECEGKIGHFPGNYVRIIEDAAPSAHAEDKPPSESPHPASLAIESNSNGPAQSATSTLNSSTNAAGGTAPPTNSVGGDHHISSAQQPSKSALNIMAKAKYAFNGTRKSELSFKVGDSIIVWEKFESGWWKGECGGRFGHFPASYVQELGPAPADEIKRIRSLTARSERAPSLERPCQAKVLYDFAARSESELDLKRGETVAVLKKLEATGWWKGELRGKTGHFPSSYVKELVVAEQEEEGEVKPTTTTTVSVDVASAVSDGGGGGVDDREQKEKEEQKKKAREDEERLLKRQKEEAEEKERQSAERERAAAEKARAIEQERAAERQQQLEREKAERERLAAERAEKERVEKEKRQREEREAKERERAEKERQEQERQEKLRQDRERMDKERREKERADRERREKEKQERERLEKERQERERQDREVLAKIERQRKEREEREEQERLRKKEEMEREAAAAAEKEKERQRELEREKEREREKEALMKSSGATASGTGGVPAASTPKPIQVIGAAAAAGGGGGGARRHMTPGGVRGALPVPPASKKKKAEQLPRFPSHHVMASIVFYCLDLSLTSMCVVCV